MKKKWTLLCVGGVMCVSVLYGCSNTDEATSSKQAQSTNEVQDANKASASQANIEQTKAEVTKLTVSVSEKKKIEQFMKEFSEEKERAVQSGDFSSLATNYLTEQSTIYNELIHKIPSLYEQGIQLNVKSFSIHQIEKVSKETFRIETTEQIEQIHKETDQIVTHDRQYTIRFVANTDKTENFLKLENYEDVIVK